MLAPLLSRTIDRGTQHATNYPDLRLVIGTISQRACGRGRPHPHGIPYFRDFALSYVPVVRQTSTVAPSVVMSRAADRN